MGLSAAPLLRYSITPALLPLLGMLAGYVLVMSTNPVRVALRDGLRCCLRFKRLWLLFALLALGYSAFQFLTFTPLQSTADLRLEQFVFWESWHWPLFSQVWRQSLLHTVESVAGIFDAAATTYPLSVLAALFLLLNWRGLHVSLVRALRKQFGLGGWLIYLGVLLSAIAALLKPFIYWLLPNRAGFLSPAHFLQTSAAVDTVAFIFEYLCAVYLQVYLITISLAWIKGLHFREGEILRFAMRRFSFVLKWLGLVVLASTLLLRLPLLIAYFRDVPGVLDYLPVGRALLATLILCFATMQVSLVLHNESLREAFESHWIFVKEHAYRLCWFLLICGLHFWFLALADEVIRAAATERALALLVWKLGYILARALVTGWLLASWVCLFRQCEIGRVNRETWIRY
ncbi:MAG: hypothetical protein H0T83_07645 [Chthoniobacterales bacterium]|nr:hypothetical protein [Chthoniobacterales bacterium]